MSENKDTEKMVATYIKLRDKRAALKADYEEKDGVLKQDMELLELALLDVCKETGCSSFKTGVGTVIRSTKEYWFTSDWENLHKLILKEQRPDLLERRISQSVMKAFIEENPEKIPPGLNREAKYTVTVRRA